MSGASKEPAGAGKRCPMCQRPVKAGSPSIRSDSGNVYHQECIR